MWDFTVELDLDWAQLSVVSHYGGSRAVYEAIWVITGQGARLEGSVKFTRAVADGFAYILEVDQELQTREDVIIMRDDEISDLLDEKLN